jgi:hypothetical protein
MMKLLFGVFIGATTASIAVAAPPVDDYYLVYRIEKYPDHYLVELVGRGAAVTPKGAGQEPGLAVPGAPAAPRSEPAPVQAEETVSFQPTMDSPPPLIPDDGRRAQLADAVRSLQQQRQELLKRDPSLAPEDRRWREERAREIIIEIRKLSAELARNR